MLAPACQLSSSGVKSDEVADMHPPPTHTHCLTVPKLGLLLQDLPGQTKAKQAEGVFFFFFWPPFSCYASQGWGLDMICYSPGPAY